MSEDGVQVLAGLDHLELNPHNDARAVVRLFQCSQCSYPVRQPLTLPCGNSICRPCIPPLYTRANITYPQNADRSEGFVCPFKDCGLEHSLADCSLDITMNKVLGMVKTQISEYLAKTGDTPLLLEEQLNWPDVVESSLEVMPRSRILHGGRIVASFTLADMGELNYLSELSYSTTETSPEGTDVLDIAVLDSIKEVVRGELECLVCYGLMLDPLTTSCGHTFCRKCVARVLDHSNLCPICRRPLLMRPGVSNEPTNKRFLSIMQGFWATELAARLVSVQQEEAMDESGWMPVFPCTLAYPLMPTFLHIFEPRYRLMIRRCLETGGRKFGMMMYNSRRTPQGPIGRSTFMQFGTILHIQRLEMFPDGRSLLETQGVYRFKVLEASMLDGYNIARIQRIDDIPLAEEEALEAMETSGPEPAADDAEGRIKHMSTQGLLQHGLDFITRARARSADWLHERVLAAYGQPPTDPALFPYWFASVLPIADDEKYLLLPTTSVRERLKMTARWIERLEAVRCLYESALANRILHLSGRSEHSADGRNADQPQNQSSLVDPEDPVSHSSQGDHHESPATPDLTESQQPDRTED